MTKVTNLSTSLHRRRVKIDRTEDRLRVVYRTRDWGSGIFLAIWLTGWTVACASIVLKIVEKQNLGDVLIAMPFLGSWLFVSCLVLKFFFQKEVIVLNDQGLDYSRRIVLPLSRRTVPLQELRGFKQFETWALHKPRSLNTKSGLRVLSLGNTLECFKDLPVRDLKWLQRELNAYLLQLRPSVKSSRRFAKVFDADADIETLIPEGNRSAARTKGTRNRAKHGAKHLPPSDCAWTLVDDGDEVSFVRRGKLPGHSLPMLLFINVFWNGIVAGYILFLLGVIPAKDPPPAGLAWWGLVAIAAIFASVGLLMLFMLAMALFAPLHQTRWTVTHDSVSLRHAWFGFGWQRQWSITRLEKLVMRNDAKPIDTPGLIDWMRGLIFDKGSFSLHFLDRHQQASCEIRDLTEGEARWMRQTIQQKRA